MVVLFLPSVGMTAGTRVGYLFLPSVGMTVGIRIGYLFLPSVGMIVEFELALYSVLCRNAGDSRCSSISPLFEITVLFTKRCPVMPTQEVLKPIIRSQIPTQEESVDQVKNAFLFPWAASFHKPGCLRNSTRGFLRQLKPVSFPCANPLSLFPWLLRHLYT